jgi:hypothetical protein
MKVLFWIAVFSFLATIVSFGFQDRELMARCNTVNTVTTCRLIMYGR